MAARRAAPLTFEVLHSSWSADGDTYSGGVHELEKASPALVRLAGHAHAAGVLNVTDGLDVSSVQSQEDGEAAYAKAVTDGGWHEGQQLQATLDEEAKARGDYGVAGDVTAGEEQA